MRLIDAEEFVEILESYGELDGAALLKDFPTAYDVDKVVEQMGELNDNEFCYANIIRIVKSGGVGKLDWGRQ